MPEPSASFVLLAYNQQAYVRDAVRAALSQACSPIEILLSDDCSADQTYAIMQEEARKYRGPHHVTLNRNETNLGVNAHINKAVEMSRGEIIIAASGDDISRPDRARLILQKFGACAPLLVHSRARVTTLDGKPAEYDYQNATFFKSTDPLSAATSKGLYLGATCAWHKDLLRKYGPLRSADTFEDLIFGFRAALEQRVALIDRELVQYRVGQGLSNTPAKWATRAEKRAHLRLVQFRHCAVLEQRLRDAGTFGLEPGHILVRTLKAEIRFYRARYQFHDLGLMRVLWQNRRHPATGFRATASELNAFRKLE